MHKPQPLSLDRLYRICPAADLGFNSTAELEPIAQPPGQERALEALELGTQISRHGFNIFVLGPDGSGKLHLARRLIQARANSQQTPSDWCYLNNFDDSTYPKLLRLPAGEGEKWCADLDELIDELRSNIPATFESDEYQNRLHELQQQLNRRQREAFEQLQQEAEQLDATLLQTPSGFTIAPVRNGEVIEPDKFQQLPEQERKEIQKNIEYLQEKLEQIAKQAPKWRKEVQEQTRKLNEEMTLLAIGHRIQQLHQRYGADNPVAAEHLEAIRNDIIENIEAFKPQDNQDSMEAVLNQYRGNLIVNHEPDQGAPVVYEDLPNHQRLVGRTEHHVFQGALLTDFRLIRPGSLHQANGGYLIIDAQKLLTQPYAWQSLKRALFAGEVRIESLEQVHGFWSTVTLEPEPMPLDTKVVLLGDRIIYYLLSAYDPDFPDLFKIEADIEDDLPRDSETERLYARLIATFAAQLDLRHLNNEAVARIIEYSSRMAEDSLRLEAGGRNLADLLQEADNYAAGDHEQIIERRHIEQTLAAQERRAARLRDRSRQMIGRGTLVINTDGRQIACVNGLSVLQLGNFSFGRPTRITATARPGKGQLIDIEREAKLGGNIHSKGVMILSRYLAKRFAPESELSLSASIAFEQSYSGVDGDSASVAELCALLSAIGELPLRQDIALTGSINQLGEVQAVGGVNEKIEGFFDICQDAGLTGTQGVALPASNVAHLMLAERVRDAVAAGQFHIYPLHYVDEAVHLLTDSPVGEQDAEGNWSEGSLYARIAARLEKFAQAQHGSRADDNSQGDNRLGADNSSPDESQGEING
ncbi:ATP-dependent protease La Type II [Halorhodospira halochloris]|uniref:endopeptidase La n=1 Tax=Halorhodospira halochloris TaxID=1052 RepID=A0A110B564_HALHR|nr:ATP-binding protein [Halorhodospira halochloris]MBK1652527.1 ATP-dependent protease [Halorhodospira halochloris]MCG5548711.1 AAA family ATPase [Halorhodospira halochloris]BAU57851.1 ATP-dependent protease La Type II [Halorhodospira halochloris]